jgi:hypothetical protein
MAIAETGSAKNSATTGTAVSVTHGLTINSGDVIVAIVHANGNGNTITDNNGGDSFTQEIQEDGGIFTNRYAIYSRVAGGSEPVSYAWTLNSSDRWSVQIRVFSGVDNSTIFDIAPSVSTRSADNSATATAPTMTTTVANTLGIMSILIDSPTITVSSPTNGYDTEVEEANQINVSYIRAWASAGATGASSATLSASGGWTAHQFALNPAAPPTGNPWHYYAQQQAILA